MRAGGPVLGARLHDVCIRKRSWPMLQTCSRGRGHDLSGVLLVYICGQRYVQVDQLTVLEVDGRDKVQLWMEGCHHEIEKLLPRNYENVIACPKISYVLDTVCNVLYILNE